MTSGGHVKLFFDSGQPSDEWMSNMLFKDLSKGKSHRFPFPRAKHLENSFFYRSYFLLHRHYKGGICYSYRG